MKRRSLLLMSIAAFGYALLYVPIMFVVIYSFNDSRLVTLWGGFSLRWYASLLTNDELLEAALLSLRVAVVSATFATALGAVVALALRRVPRLRGRLLLSSMVTAPLVMPEIITGLSLLFLFISMTHLLGWPTARGATTITIAHITFSMAYVVVVVRSRLAAMDETLEEAAMDLGGRPVAVFFDRDFTELSRYIEYPAIYRKDQVIGRLREARPGESPDDAKARAGKDIGALLESPFYDVWAEAAIDEILSALHERQVLETK